MMSLHVKQLELTIAPVDKLLKPPPDHPGIPARRKGGRKSSLRKKVPKEDCIAAAAAAAFMNLTI